MTAIPGTRKAMFKPVIAVAALVAPVAVLSGCATNQSTNQTTSSPPPGTERITTQLKRADGTAVANATFDFANGYATVTVETVSPHILSPGFHGLHIHSVGQCEANSVAPTGGPSGDFLSAGGHFQAPGHTGHPASGDLTSLEVRSDGSAKLVTTTDAFTAADLRGGSALIIHEGADNFANIPQRYTQNGTAGPDQETLATGDSGKRVACGVIAASSATNTTSSSTTPAAPVTTAGTTTGSTTSPTSTPSSTTSSTTTSPSTVTVTVTPSSPPTVPGGPGPGG
jgi:superoxide dismutase, Cu-Zn family